jgi:hypothetical protein
LERKGDFAFCAGSENQWNAQVVKPAYLQAG